MHGDSHSSAGFPRRTFLKGTAGVLAAAAIDAGRAAAPLAADGPPDRMIGIQVGAASIFDEGADEVLDALQQKGKVNTLFLTTFTYGRGLAGRQIPGQPFPDHGPQESDEHIFHGGNYATPHPEFYRDTVLKVPHAPDYGDRDVVATVLPLARRRGLKLFCSIEDVFRRDVPGVEEVAEVDLRGRKTGALCLLHPAVRAFWTGLATDLCRSYDIDGILFFNERNGPLLNALGASHAQNIASSRVTCFCPYHERAARDQGVRFERVREGYETLDKYIRAALQGERPSDGYFVEFWRLIAEYPEILIWDRLFDEAKHQILADVQRAVKGVRPGLEVGFHIEHVNSFNPIFRATRSYENLAGKADFLKVVVYNNCGGERYAHFIENVGSTVFRDVPKAELLRFNNHLLNYGPEADLEQLPGAGLSADYVFRETQRARAGVQGRCKILPGIDIGIPTAARSRKASPDDTYAATAAALRAGAEGLIFSRKYSEMRLENLAAGGRAVADSRPRG
jgi:hypothetical protein